MIYNRLNVNVNIMCLHLKIPLVSRIKYSFIMIYNNIIITIFTGLPGNPGIQGIQGPVGLIGEIGIKVNQINSQLLTVLT